MNSTFAYLVDLPRPVVVRLLAATVLCKSDYSELEVDRKDADQRWLTHVLHCLDKTKAVQEDVNTGMYYENQDRSGEYMTRCTSTWTVCVKCLRFNHGSHETYNIYSTYCPECTAPAAIRSNWINTKSYTPWCNFDKLSAELQVEIHIEILSQVLLINYAATTGATT